MKSTIRRIGIAAFAVIVVLFLIPYFLGVNGFRPTIESKLSSALGRKVEVGNLSLSILQGTLSAGNLSIADDPEFSKSPFLTAKRLKIGVELIPLIFSKKLNVTGITVDEPSIVLLSAPNGTWNFSSLGGNEARSAPKSVGTPPDSLSVAELKVTDGKVQVGKVNSQVKPLTIDGLSIKIKNFSTGTQFPFTLTAALPGSGTVELEGQAGPVASTGVPIQAGLKIRKLNLAAIDTDRGGIGDLEGMLDSDGKIARVTGTLSLDKLKLAPKGTPAGRSIQVKLATEYNLGKRAGTISQGEISVGKAAAHLTGGYYAEGEATVLNMKFNALGMPIEEVEALLPAVGVTLPADSRLKGGTLSSTLAITGPANKLVISGPVRLENTSLAGFDLVSKLAALSALSGKAVPSKDTTIQNASLDSRVAPEGTQINSINVTVPSLGILTGSGTISPEGALNFGMKVELAGSGGKSNRGPVPFIIAGTAANPQIVPDVKNMAGDAVKQAITGRASPAGGAGSKGLGAIFKKR